MVEFDSFHSQDIRIGWNSVWVKFEDISINVVRFSKVDPIAVFHTSTCKKCKGDTQGIKRGILTFLQCDIFLWFKEFWVSLLNDGFPHPFKGSLMNFGFPPPPF